MADALRKALFAAVVLAAAGALYLYFLQAKREAPPPAVAPRAAGEYAGAKACASCHAREAEAWRGSHHDLAMQHASEASVLGNFEGAKFSYAGVTSTFFRRDGKFFVHTDGADGKLHDYEIRYAFGVTPLQQYLVEFPDGRLQALSIAWDSRPKDRGGQRWFHLYPGQAVKAGDRLHWTGIDQNWNHQCAECHSTNLRKNFDAASNTFRTSWSELNVACEACHGPGSNHAAWARKEGDWQRIADKGLAVALDERRGAAWVRKSGAETAERSPPRASQREVETCARCHARRGQLTDDYRFGQPLADTHRPSLLEEGLYWPDGQMRDEVYNYASFLQSKMFAKGVTCSDCHEPHSLKLRAPGNTVCAQCHDPAHFDGAKHTHHAAGSAGAQCAACHMPTTTYMVVDPRHDHSFRVPRPDRSAAMGVPNACNQCHKDRAPQWAAAQIRGWEPQPDPGYQKFAEALHAGARSASDARARLMDSAADAGTPAIARASALALLGRYPGPLTTQLLGRSLDDADPLVRGAAVEALAGVALETRARLLPRMLDDPVRSVRIAAARALAGAPEERLAPEQRVVLARALEQYVDAQRFNADRPDAHGNLGALHMERGEIPAAEAAFRRALEIDPAFMPATVNLADLQRARGDEKSAEATLRAGLRRDPRNAALQYALGLALVRQQRGAEAIAALREAARLAPGDPRYAYVHAVAIHGAGRQAEAIGLLEGAQRRFPGDSAILFALATMERDRGRRAEALGYARKLAELVPDEPQAQALLRELQR